MWKAALLTALVALPQPIGPGGAPDDYPTLAAEFEKLVAENGQPEGVVAPLLPDRFELQDRFVAAAKAHEGEAALPYIGWLLQNAPRNPEAHGAAVALLDAMADAEAAQLGTGIENEKDRYGASRKAVSHLKYNRVDDATFARTLLEAKVLARAAADPGLKEASKRSVFKLQSLQVGMVAPDIVGKDLDDVAFKLSDYRGKVVVVDFWGDW